MKKIAIYLAMALVCLNGNCSISHANCLNGKKNEFDKNVNLTKRWVQVHLDSSIETLNWQSVAASGNGKYQTAVVKKIGDDGTGGNIFLSDNYGKSWRGSPYNFNLSWEGIAISKSGKYQVAVAEGDFIYISSTYGKIWRQVPQTQGNWVTVAMSANGKYQTAVANDFYNKENGGKGISISSDYGKNWKSVLFPNAWIGVSMSADGRIQTATSFRINGTDDPFDRQGYVYQSFDHGETWNQNTRLPKSHYTMVAMSGSGKTQIVGDNNCNFAPAIPGPLYISYNYGATFKETSANYQNWLNGSVSQNGKYMLVVSYQQSDSEGNIVPNTGLMVSSSNYGKLWKTTDAPLSTWTSVALGANGGVGTATAWGFGIFIRK